MTMPGVGPIRIAHTADWHIAAQGHRMDRDTGLNARLVDSYEAAWGVVNDAVETNADILLHCGDVFNSPHPTPSEVHLVRDIFHRAGEEGLCSIIILGNHEAVKALGEYTPLDYLADLPRVLVVTQPALIDVWRDGDKWTASFTAAEHERAWGDTTCLQIAALPWPNAGLLARDPAFRSLDVGARNQAISGKMVDILRGLVVQRDPALPFMAAGHLTVDVSKADSGRLMMLGGDWTMPAAELTGLPASYVALGHIHRQQVLSTHAGLAEQGEYAVVPTSQLSLSPADGAFVAYSGSPQPFTFGEEKNFNAWTLVEVDWRPPAGLWSVQRIECDYRPFQTHDLVSIEAMLDWQKGEPEPIFDPMEYVQTARDSLKGAIVRMRVPDHEGLDVRALRAALDEAGVFEASIEVVRQETQRRRATAMTAQMDVPAALAEWVKVQAPDLERDLPALQASAANLEETLERGGNQ